jgi:hypothetical protein
VKSQLFSHFPVKSSNFCLAEEGMRLRRGKQQFETDAAKKDSLG